MGEKPPALSPELQAMLGTYREARTMPADAKARVRDRLRATSDGRPVWLWASVGAVAAALLLWAAASLTGSLQTTATDDPGSQAAMQATASDAEPAVAEQPPEASPARAPVHQQVDPSPPPAPEPESVEPEPESIREAAPPPTAQPRPEPATARAKPRRPKAAATPEHEPAEAAPQTPASRLGAENRLIATTWEHVRAKRYAKAKASLREHASAFPQGVLAPERRALQVIVDCLANPRAAAGKAEAYAASGRSTLLAKVRSACDAEKSADP